MISLVYTSARPNLVKNHIETWLNLAQDKNDIEIVLCVDKKFHEQFLAIGTIPNTKLIVNYDRPCCVDGWNKATRNSKGNIIIQLSDDLLPPKNWDVLVKTKMGDSNIKIALAINDSLTASTTFLPHSFITRNIFQERGYLFHDSYWSMWCDNEYSAVMSKSGYVNNAMDIKFIHNHGKIVDNVSKTHNGHHAHGKTIYDFRNSINFDRWKYPNYLSEDENSDGIYSSKLGVRFPSYYNQIPKSARYYIDLHTKSLKTRNERFGTAPEKFKDLQVLIPTVPNRAVFLGLLLKEFDRQGIQYIIDDRVDIPVGKKRNDLISKATSKYITFVDDDDWVPHDYREKIEESITNNDSVEVFLYDVLTTVNDSAPVLSLLGISSLNKTYDGVFLRTANHLMVWKREIASIVKFPDINNKEDAEWASKITPLVKTHMRIHSILYFYEYLRSNTETQK